jgi:hypothetical protein
LATFIVDKLPPCLLGTPPYGSSTPFGYFDYKGISKGLALGSLSQAHLHKEERENFSEENFTEWPPFKVFLAYPRLPEMFLVIHIFLYF